MKLAPQPGMSRVMVGKTLRLQAELRPATDTTGVWGTVTWGSSDVDVATVVGDATLTTYATVTGVAVGAAVITATLLGQAHRFLVDVVANLPDSVTVVVPVPRTGPWE